MIEKIDINEVERNLPNTNTVDSLRGLRGMDSVAVSPKMLLRSHMVEYEINLINCNNINYNSIIAGYQWSNAPQSGIALMETILYSKDWIIQRFTVIGDSPKMWIRTFYNGSTWGSWKSISIT